MAGMGEVELDALRLEQVCQPLPAEGASSATFASPPSCAKIARSASGVVRHPAREQLQTLLVEGGNMRGPAVKVDADVDHGGLLSDPELTTPA
jgi:hypothetical protein